MAEVKGAPEEEAIDVELTQSPYLFDESSFSMSLKKGGVARAFTRSRTGLEEIDARPLFVDDVWPGCKYLARFLDDEEACGITDQSICTMHVLELGAGCSLPSVIVAKRGARRVISTDFPAPGVIETITKVLHSNGIEDAEARALRWGNKEDEDTVLSMLPAGAAGFDLILVAEPLWQDTVSSHSALAHSISRLLSPAAGAATYLCFCHRPSTIHKPEDDLAFFSVAAREYKLSSQKVRTVSGEYSDVLDSAPLDVHLYKLQRQPLSP